MKQRTRKLLTLLLIAAMVMSLMVPALAADTAQSETPYTYDAGDYTFGKISHPNSAPGQPDGLVDYTGNGTVAVTGTADGADGQGDRGQSYAWAAMAYGDYVYVGTCYAAMGQTLTAMDTVMGHKFDEETMRAELNAIFNGTFFYGQEDSGNSGGVLVKVNVHTGEMTLLMSKSLNGIAPLFRNAIRYKDKLYFCGSVNTNGRGDCSGDWNDPDAWTWTPVVGDKADGAKYTFGIDPARTRAAACNLCIYDGYLYIGEYNDEEIPLEELMFSQDFGFLARNLEQSVNLYRMSIGSDGTEQMELVVGEPTEMFPAGGILCKRSGFGDYENQYFWQSKVFDGKLFLGTFDTSSLLEPLGQFTNGDLLHMSRDEWASQIGYLKVLLKLLLNQDKNGDGTLLAADADTDAAIDAAVDAVNEEADSPETFSLTDAQYDTLRQGIDDGAYAAAYSVSTLGSLRRLNSLLAKLTDLVETNDIAGFVDIYQQVCDLYSGISDKLPDSMKELYEMLVRITELENMKDLVICLNKLSTATRGFGLYTITSENGKLTLDTLTRDGFGDPFNHGLRAFAVNDEQGWMVIGTANPFMGTQLWRTTVDMTDPMDRFTDLDPNGWAYPSIEYCVRHGLMSGMSDTIFSPNTVTTRAQLVQVLYNLEGKPDVSDVAVPFTDAASGWYRDAVAWAYKTGVVDGMSPTTFAPNNTVTREQVAVILMRYLTKVCGVERTWTPDDLSGFADGGSVSGWARAGMADAVALGLFGGTQDRNGQVWLRPGAGTTRAETAALLQRMCTKVLGIG